MKNKRAFGWFLFGLGGQLQIVASLSFSELFVFVIAPFLFVKEQFFMKRDGVMPFFYLSLALVFGCIVACIANHTAPVFVLRGLAVCCLMPCSIIVSHWMFRKNMSGVKWYFLGGAISGVLCTFVFQKSVEMGTSGEGLTGMDMSAHIMAGATYWIHRLNAFVTLPMKGWYLNCPIFYCIGGPLFMAGFSLLTSVSGRGSASRAIASAVLVLIGNKRQWTIRNRICRHFGMIVLVGFIGAFCVKQGYQIAATNGWLGEAALKKYESQTKGDTRLIALLLGGRMESFCGLIACVDKPIIGFGPWAMDNGGYQGKFLSKYGNQEDYMNYLRHSSRGAVGLIPCHAVITELWLWYGIFGLLFCIYILFVMLRYLKQDCWAVPQWYFWLAASIPGMFWDMCFNPLMGRIFLPMFVVACLMVRAVRKGTFLPPLEMQQEIVKNERKKI